MSAERMRRFNHFKRLGLKRSADTDEIQKAYRALALLYHPDKNANNPDAVEIFKLIKESRDLLSDAKMRELYETQLELDDLTSGFGGSGSSSNPYGTLSQTSAMRDIVSAHLKTGGSSLWGAGKKKRNTTVKPKVAPITKKLWLTLEQLDDGMHIVHKYKRTRSISMGRDIERVEEVVVNVPPAAMDGDRVLIKGAGHEYFGHEPGDLVFILCEKKHDTYTRRVGADLYIERKVGPFEMLTGCEMDVNLVCGRRARLKCKPPLRDGISVRFQNLGMRRKELAEGNPDDERGDIVVCFSKDDSVEGDITQLSAEQLVKLAALKAAAECAASRDSASTLDEAVH